MQTKIHTYTSDEPMLKVNAYIVETENQLVVVDTTLTMSDSKALKMKAGNLNKPIAGIILTHGHPDHVAGTYNISPDGDVPIYATAPVKKLMEDSEQIKHKQWSAIFGNEWIPKWVYPNTIVKNEDTITIAGLDFKVIDIGSGGDCDANSIWLLDSDVKVAFVGDLLYKQNHSFLADGSVLRWLANLKRLEPVLKNYHTYYIGHGPECSFEDIAKQKEYFIIYCSEVLNATNGTAIFTDESKKIFEQKMYSLYPDYGCQFMVSLSADKAGQELVILSNN